MPVVPAVATDRYYVNHEIGDYLRIAEEAAPHLLRLYTIGTSYEGRPLFMAEITNRATGEGHDKPALWIDGGWRGGQLLGSSACLELVRQLTAHYGRDPVISDLLDHVTFYVCPRLAADAADLSLHTGEWCWSSTRPSGGGLAGLRPGDANGDGRSLQMRLLDPLGQWKVSRRDARLMVPRAPDDRQGPFYRLMPEGLCEGNGRATHGAVRSRLDLERNFPTSGPWDAETCGPYPLSEPETRVVADFFRSHANLGAVVSFGNLGSGGLSLPEPAPADGPLLTRLGRRLQEWTGLTVTHSQAPGYLQWAHQNQGLLVVRAEPWNLARVVGVERFDPERPLDEPEQAGVIRWLDQNCPGAFYPWTAFDHPQLGAVELGGWEWLYSWLNPPPGGLLQSELERFCKLVLGMAQSLPRLHVQEFVEETLGWAEAHEGEEYSPLRKLRAVVTNRGFLPTWVCGGNTRPNRHRLELQLMMDHGTSVVLGKERQNGQQLAGVGLSEAESPVPYTAGDEAEARLEVEWLVQGAGRIQLEVRHPRAGVCHVNVSSDRASHSASEPLAAPPPPAYAAPPLPPPPPPPGRPPSRPGTPAPMAAPPQQPPQDPQRPPAPPARPGMPQVPNRPAAIARPPGAQQPPAPTPPQQPQQAPPPRQVPSAAPRSGLLGQPPGAAAAAAQAPPKPPVPLAAPTPPPAPAGGRVLGSPPPKAGAPVSAYAAHARELIQANQQRPQNNEPPPRLGAGSDFEPFSPGLPMKSAFSSGQPVESPASVDFDDLGMPPDPMDSRVLPPMILRKREKGK